MPAPTFVVSTGRCGSTLLSNILAAHPDILSLSEVFMAANSLAFVGDKMTGAAFWRRFSTPRNPMSKILTPETCPKEFKYEFRNSSSFTQETLPPILYMALSSLPGDPDALYFDLQSSMNARPKAALADHYLSMFDWLKKRFQKKVWVERSGASLIFVPALVRLFPDSKFIHLHRDGRETAISIQRYPPLSLLAKSWRDAGRFGLDMLAPPFRLGDSRALAMMEKMASPFHRGAGALADLETAGAFWSSMVLTGLEALDSVPADRKLTVRYERLVAEPGNQLTEILDFIDPEFSGADWIRSASGLIAPGANNSEALTPQEFCALTNACRPGLLALGYEA